MPKEGDIVYEQQRDVILKLKYFQLQVLLVIPNDTTFFVKFVKIWNKTFLILASKAN